MEEKKEYFMHNSALNIFQRGFQTLQKAFVPSYLSKFIGNILTALFAVLVYYILYNLWKDFKPPRTPDDIPYNLIYTSIAIGFIFIFVSYFIDLISKGISYHSFTTSLIGEAAGPQSVQYSFKNILNWFLITILVIIGTSVYLLIAGLLAYRLGEPGIIACIIMLVVYVIAMLILYPIFTLVVPIMVMEKKNLFQALVRSFVLGFKNYWRSVGINSLNLVLMWFITNLFIFLLIFFQRNLDLSLGFRTVLETMSSMTIFWIILAVYISVRSMISVLQDSFIISLCSSMICKEESPENAFNSIISSI